MDMHLTPMSAVLVAATLGLASVVIAGIAYAARRTQSDSAGQGARPARIAGGLTAVTIAWLAIVFLLTARGTLAAQPTPSVPVIAFALAVPIIVGSWALAVSGSLRRFVGAIPQPWLVGAQLYRILGFVFVVAYLEHHMPAVFALPAGIGDVIVGLTAPLAAYALLKSPRWGVLAARAWNALGIADLVLAVSLGFLSSPSAFEVLSKSAPNAAVSRFPFVLVPAFLVPVSILLHVFSLWRLRSAPSRAFSMAPPQSANPGQFAVR